GDPRPDGEGRGLGRAREPSASRDRDGAEAPGLRAGRPVHADAFGQAPLKNLCLRQQSDHNRPLGAIPMVGKKIAVIGAGNMGTALLRGILASGWGSKKNLIASHPKRSKAIALAAELGITVTEQNDKAVRQADIVVFAVKPQILESVLEETRRA